MSLSLRDELRVVLSPEQLLLLRIGRSFTWRGMRQRVIGKKAITCGVAEDEAMPWSEAVRALEAELPALAQGIAFATVVLSNHFAHYAMVPWSGAPMDDEEETAYARHFFRKLYGPAAESWELRLNPDRAGAPQLACAVDRRLTDSVRASFATAGIALRSMQPHLMVAYNSCRTRLRKSSAWFVLFEAGSLCLALLHRGGWGSVRTLRAGDDWYETLPRLLEREAYLTDEEAATDEVLLWAPDFDASGLDAASLLGTPGWRVSVLHPAVRPGLKADYDRRFAAAMSV